MGTTAWTEVKSDDLVIDNSGIRGGSFFIKIGESHLHAYDWGCDCPDTGYLELRDFRRKLDSIKFTDLDWWPGYNYGFDEIEYIDLSKIGVTPTYGAKVDFTLNGGWTGPLSLKSGEVDISDPKYGNDVYIDVSLGIKFKGEPRIREGYVTLYCDEVIFHPSRTFTQIYEYCWDNHYEEDFDQDEVPWLFSSMNAKPKSRRQTVRSKSSKTPSRPKARKPIAKKPKTKRMG